MDTKIQYFTGPPTFYCSHKSVSLKQGYYIDGIEQNTMKLDMKIWENYARDSIKCMLHFQYIKGFSNIWKITEEYLYISNTNPLQYQVPNT